MRRPPLNPRAVERQNQRERNVGLDPDDDAARWLDEHDPPPAPKTPKSASKNKLLHRWRRRAS